MSYLLRTDWRASIKEHYRTGAAIRIADPYLLGFGKTMYRSPLRLLNCVILVLIISDQFPTSLCHYDGRRFVQRLYDLKGFELSLLCRPGPRIETHPSLLAWISFDLVRLATPSRFL